MRRRYTRVGGRTVETATVYTATEHGISPQDLDHDAVKVVRRLQRNGYESYIVGGAVRDLLLGKRPKDFDVATAASPTQIRKLFRNSRAIGKRFRLVHILFHDKVLEVSTFRSEDAEGFKNVYGTIDEDVKRRDFTANALFLDPNEHTIVDFVDGVQHIRSRMLRPVIPLNRIFVEDPVRIIRACKYACTGSLKLPWLVRRRIRRDGALLAETPGSRMTEEVFKILNTGSAAPIVRMLMELGLLVHMVPQIAELASQRKEFRSALLARLEALDRRWASDGPLPRDELLVALGGDFLLAHGPFRGQQRVMFGEAYRAFKDWLQPVTPANREVESALEQIFHEGGRLQRSDDSDDEVIGGRRRRRRPRRRRTRGPRAGASDGEPTPASD